MPPTLVRFWPALAALRWPVVRTQPRLDWMQGEISTAGFAYPFDSAGTFYCFAQACIAGIAVFEVGLGYE